MLALGGLVSIVAGYYSTNHPMSWIPTAYWFALGTTGIVVCSIGARQAGRRLASLESLGVTGATVVHTRGYLRANNVRRVAFIAQELLGLSGVYSIVTHTMMPPEWIRVGSLGCLLFEPFALVVNQIFDDTLGARVRRASTPEEEHAAQAMLDEAARKVAPTKSRKKKPAKRKGGK